ncbi:hypothetical protein [Corynebacterium heidelbergense]|uniref:Uncharacterized protein n=1 Tax=Corynebacterium heidelbergense TaxID=2055947 RepID=A0A364VED8_9CORY|nr:hypothetical protein [Corynebacterium heidelbergense]RAV35003.1 hypothetical protein CWC39_00045 [Corynebacterium heidelbergense]WCZ37454.1 hypothetical protein CHEID_09640 [Corynebacterium heidelbergense]
MGSIDSLQPLIEVGKNLIDLIINASTGNVLGAGSSAVELGSSAIDLSSGAQGGEAAGDAAAAAGN